jgi:hypothetical protein
MVRFILVNGRNPRLTTYCVLCGTKIEGNYVRDISTQFCYCDDGCFDGHPILPQRALVFHARAAS